MRGYKGGGSGTGEGMAELASWPEGRGETRISGTLVPAWRRERQRGQHAVLPLPARGAAAN